MSRAFVREDDASAESLPERPVSEFPNYVTTSGMHQIDAAIAGLEHAADEARHAQDDDALARIERDLRYWLQRKSSARVVEPEAEPAQVRFGVRVTLRDARGGELSFRLVGEDEADPAAGLISWVAPLAQQLLGREPGDEITWQGRLLEIVALT